MAPVHKEAAHGPGQWLHKASGHAASQNDAQDAETLTHTHTYTHTDTHATGLSLV